MNFLFENIPQEELDNFLKSLKADTFTCKKNVSILHLLNSNSMIGIVIEGYLEIIKIDYNGNKQIIESIDQNNLLDTNLAIKGTDYDIVPLEESKIVLIDYQNILNYSDKANIFYQSFLINLLNIVSAKITEKNERIQILTQKTIRNKILEYFKIISAKNKSKHIYLPKTFTYLAEYLGVDRSAMTRELKNLKDEGFIQIKGKKITLLY